MDKRTVVEIKSLTIIKIILIILGFVALYWLRNLLFILFFAVMISAAVDPFARWLQDRRVPRAVGVVIQYLLFFGVVAFFVSLVAPIMVTEIKQFAELLPGVIEDISNLLERSAAQASVSGDVSFVREIQTVLNDLSNFLAVSSASFLDLMLKVFGDLFSLLAILVISFYLALTPDGMAVFIKSVLPAKYENDVIRFWGRTQKKIGRWFQGQLLLSISVGLMVFISMSLLGVKYALLLGVLAMMLEVVPVAGPIIAGLPALALAFAQSPALAFWTFIIYLGIQQLEANLLTPIIMGKSVGLSPVTVIIALLIGATVAGIPGVLIAVPAAVVATEALESLAAQKTEPTETK